MEPGSPLSRGAASRAAPQWRVALNRLHLTVLTGDFDRGLAFVDRVGALAAAQDHHPDIDLRYSLVHLALSTHDAGGITAADLDLAAAIDQVVAELGLHPAPTRLTVTEIAIDAMDIAAVRPFWAAVTGYGTAAGPEEIVDPAGLGPAIWFQQMDQPRPQRNRIHLDVTVAHDEAADRIAAALAAGGSLVSDAAAPSFWILADPEGNEACVCTWQGRDERE